MLFKRKEVEKGGGGREGEGKEGGKDSSTPFTGDCLKPCIDDVISHLCVLHRLWGESFSSSRGRTRIQAHQVPHVQL